MFWEKLAKVGDSYVITIPYDQIDHFNLHDGDMLAIELMPAEQHIKMPAGMREAFEASWRYNEIGYRYLADPASVNHDE